MREERALFSKYLKITHFLKYFMQSDKVINFVNSNFLCFLLKVMGLTNSTSLNDLTKTNESVLCDELTTYPYH